MLLSRVQLRNFRCFDELDVDLQQTTVLVGPNDSGKSTVLEAVRWLLDSDAPRDWPAATRADARADGEAVSVSIIGTLSDVDHDRFGRLAVGGSVRIGRSPATHGDDLLWMVLDTTQLAEWLLMTDNSYMREEWHIGDDEPIETALRHRGLLMTIGGETWADIDSCWALTEPTLHFLDDLQFGTGVSAIALGSSHDSNWAPEAVIVPIVRRAVRHSVAGATSGLRVPEETRMAFGLHGQYPRIGKALVELEGAVDELMDDISSAHSGALDPASAIEEVGWDASIEPSFAVSTLIDSLWALVRRKEDDTGGVPLASLGPGTRRSLAIRALALYRDPRLWPTREDEFSPASLAVLLVEEPENGLHPRAQRDLAQTLKEWATFGLQLMVVTHSPAFVNAAESGGILLTRRTVATAQGRSTCTVTRAPGLAAVRDELGVSPSDVLLARRFVLVEGETEQAVLDIWARKLGFDLRADGVQLVPMGGYGASDRIARFVTLAYEGADFVVVLDNGSDTVRVKTELDARFGSQVKTIILSRTDLEGFYHPDAVAGWLHETAGDVVDDWDVGEVLESTPSRVKGLSRLAKRYLGRSFQKVDDGRAIAHQTTESQIDPEVKDLLLRLGS